MWTGPGLAPKPKAPAPVTAVDPIVATVLGLIDAYELTPGQTADVARALLARLPAALRVTATVAA